VTDQNDRIVQDVRDEHRIAERPISDHNHPNGSRRSLMPWILGLLLIAAVVVGGFFVLGGDVDTDTNGKFDVQVPSADVDVQGPDVSINTPDVKVDPGSVDIDRGKADANAGTGG
jgi:hypothetical protein